MSARATTHKVLALRSKERVVVSANVSRVANRASID